MKVRIACISAALALGGSLPASAADWNDGAGSLKDMSGSAAVAVPAPMPVADVSAAEWYIGIAAGGVLSDESNIESSNGSVAVLENEDLSNTLMGGMSFGRYITPSLRAEIAFDVFDSLDISNPGEQTRQTAVAGTGTRIHYYDVTRTDQFELRRSTGLFNILYDLPLSDRIKPYAGGGVGFSWRSMRRSYTETSVCNHTEDLGTTPPTSTTPCTGLATGQAARTSTTGNDETDRFDVALAAMVGVSVEVAPNIIWDNGYQVLWEKAGIQQMAHTFGGDSTVSYEDSKTHQFRTGIRYTFD